MTLGFFNSFYFSNNFAYRQGYNNSISTNMYMYPIDVQLTTIPITTARITIMLAVTYNYVATET